MATRMDRDREYVGKVENRACAACNNSGVPIRNALCAECEKVHWFCPECGRILDRDTDAVCTCGFPQNRLEARLLEVEAEERRKQADKEAQLRAEEALWSRRLGGLLMALGAGIALVGGAGCLLGAGTWSLVTLAVGVLALLYGVVKRLHLGA